MAQRMTMSSGSSSFFVFIVHFFLLPFLHKTNSRNSCLLPSSVRLGLEAELESEFNLPRRAKGVNTGSDTYPSNIVSDGVGSVDLPDGSRQQPI